MDDLARYVAEIMRLRDRVEELEALIGTKFVIPIPGVTAVGRAMLGLLRKHSIVPSEFALAAIYGNEHPKTPYYATTIVSRLNKSLKRYNIFVKCDRANGYYLDAENKSRLAGLVADLSRPVESVYGVSWDHAYLPVPPPGGYSTFSGGPLPGLQAGSVETPGHNGAGSDNS